MPEEYWTIVSRYHKHRNHPGIQATTRLQLEQLALRCSPRLALHVNKFLRVNFSEPPQKTG